MTDIIKADYNFEGHVVRLANSDPAAPEWIAKDVCEVLGLGNPRTSLALLDADEKGVHIVDTPGGPQEMATVTEAGLYSLISRSRKPAAKRFRRWVNHEVLPQIRRTGSYGQPQIDTQALCTTVATAVLAVLAPHIDALALRQSNDTCIGEQGSRIILARLREYSKRMSNDPKAQRSIRGLAEMDLRVAVQHNGTGRSWANLPTTKWADAKAKLDEMDRMAGIVQAQQLTIKGAA